MSMQRKTRQISSLASVSVRCLRFRAIGSHPLIGLLSRIVLVCVWDDWDGSFEFFTILHNMHQMPAVP
jgi:hypothetical protein